MTRLLSDEVILGVDTHLDKHVGVIVDGLGKFLGHLTIETNSAGYHKLLKWVQSLGKLQRAGIEGTGTYGAGLARFLSDQGVQVFEINRPDRSMRRFRGKSDPTDAESAARTVLFGNACAIPKLQSGAAEAMRIVSVARRSAIKARTQTINQLRALLISAPDKIQSRLWRAKPAECVKCCIHIRVNTPLLVPTTFRNSDVNNAG